ncbi:MAG: HDIG domain-containing protein [Myxococcota bacterium]|nr:HDIG domain-containing protein [Myxococcota bacterium]
MIISLGALLAGLAGGYALVSLRSASEPLDASDESRKDQRELRRFIQRKWRNRLRRKRRELKQRQEQLDDARAELKTLAPDAVDAEKIEEVRSAVEEKNHKVNSLDGQRKAAFSRLDEAREGLVGALLKAADVEAESFTDGLMHGLIQNEEERSVRHQRRASQNLELESENSARQLIENAVYRYAESHSVDRLRSSIRIENSERHQLLLSLSPIFENELGMSLEATEREGMISIRGADPLTKETSQRILSKMLEGTADEAVFTSLKHTIEEQMKRQSSACLQEAIDELSAGEITGECRRLLDRLRYRHSYRQNQWRHAAEVGFLSGMLAWELGLDAHIARRGGLMHDIGKSMTHEVEGGHAVLGAVVARGENENAGVASCIGSHHGDEPPVGLEPYLVAAGDAISGARPGARVQGGEHHETLVRDLERIGRNPRKVDNAYTVRGGRELRVLLGMEDRSGRRIKISPDEMKEMASEMKSRIEDELTYPGTIDVTVIRRVVAEVTAR